MELDKTYDDYEFPTTAPVAQDGHPGHLRPDQQAMVYQLRMLLEAEGCKDRLDTLTLLRFLRARKFDVMASKKMFMDCEAWRKNVGLDEEVPRWDFPEKAKLFEFYPQYYHKTDKDGRPVYIERLGGIDLATIDAISSSERMLMNLAVEYERLADPRLPACSRKAGHLLETCCSIMDLKGVSIMKVPQVYSHLRQASDLSQNYYPERLGRLFIINAPWGFSTVWSVVKGWLDPVTVKKIHILGWDYQKELLAQIPAENLPKEYGGTCECEGGCQFSDAGPWKEEQWYRPAKWEIAVSKEGKAGDAIKTEAGTISAGEGKPPKETTTAQADDPAKAAA